MRLGRSTIERARLRSWLHEGMVRPYVIRQVSRVPFSCRGVPFSDYADIISHQSRLFLSSQAASLLMLLPLRKWVGVFSNPGFHCLSRSISPLIRAFPLSTPIFQFIEVRQLATPDVELCNTSHNQVVPGERLRSSIITRFSTPKECITLSLEVSRAKHQYPSARLLA